MTTAAFAQIDFYQLTYLPAFSQIVALDLSYTYGARQAPKTPENKSRRPETIAINSLTSTFASRQPNKTRHPKVSDN